MAVTPIGTAAEAGAGWAAQRASSARNSRVAPAALMHTARAAFQPKVASMKGVSQAQGPATISTGGAAKWVRVPPIETFTNSTPRVAYLSRAGTRGWK